MSVTVNGEPKEAIPVPTEHAEANGAADPADDATEHGKPAGQADAAPQGQGHPVDTATQEHEAHNGSKLLHPHPSELKGKVNKKKEKLKNKAKPPGGFDDTPLPSVPQGYTVKFTFVRASNLPVSDLHTTAADPFIVATLTTSLPKRHKEDPDMVHRTRTVHRSTEPEWNEEWVVANVPASGFSFKCRVFDEDWPDSDDRLGNLTLHVPALSEDWRGYPLPEGREFPMKKRMGSKRAYILKGIASALNSNVDMTPRLTVAIEVLGKSDPPHGHMYTVGPTTWVKHYSPTIGRLTGTKVNKDETKDSEGTPKKQEKKTQKYDFQANEIQLCGPVPPSLYHRYVEFRPLIGMMFSSAGLRGRILNAALHKQHSRVYTFDSSTEYGAFEACSPEASTTLLKMAHFDEGGRTFTYVLTLDGLLRFTETGSEFGIDLLSKHTMHSDVATYIACSGEFFVRRLAHPPDDTAGVKEETRTGSSGGGAKDVDGSGGEDKPNPPQPTHPSESVPGGPPDAAPPVDPSLYQLVIDNDSGTYRPDKRILPDLKAFLERQFPGLGGIVVLDWHNEELKQMKEDQKRVKKDEGRGVFVVQNRSPGASSFSSSDESVLGEMEALQLDDAGEGEQAAEGSEANEKRKKKKKKPVTEVPKIKSGRERAWDVLEEPKRLKDEMGNQVDRIVGASAPGKLNGRS